MAHQIFLIENQVKICHVAAAFPHGIFIIILQDNVNILMYGKITTPLTWLPIHVTFYVLNGLSGHFKPKAVLIILFVAD